MEDEPLVTQESRRELRRFKVGCYAMTLIAVLVLAAAMIRDEKIQLANQKLQWQLDLAKSERDTFKDDAKKMGDVLTATTSQRDAWKDAALKEYDALQKIRANHREQVDWDGVLNAVPSLLKVSSEVSQTD